MKKRITFTVEEAIIKNIHNEQAKRIARTNKSVSFSELIEEALEKKYGE